MQKISETLKLHYLEPFEYNEEEDIKGKVNYTNGLEGDLNKRDGYNCPKCKNKGFIADIQFSQGHYREISIRCDCMNTRKVINSLLNCGISLETLKRCKFENYKREQEWQQELYNKVMSYISDVVENKKPYWFYLGGQTGAGKTMILTATFRKLITKKCLNGYYLLWNNESKQLLNYEKRNVEKYSERLYELTTCDILYIDDFFKLDSDNSFNSDNTSLAYEIINNRYMNKKLTLISTELTKDKLNEKDSAIFGRIFEMTNNGEYFIQVIGDDKNYRTKEIGENKDYEF